MFCFIVMIGCQGIIGGVSSIVAGYNNAMQADQENDAAVSDSEAADQNASSEAEGQSDIMSLLTLPLAEVGGLVAVCVVVFLFAVFDKRKVRDILALKKVAPSSFGFASLLAFCYGAVAMGFIALVQSLVDTGYSEATSTITSGNILITAICSCILAPVIEELIFRAAAFRFAGELMPKIAAAIVSSIFFALAHGLNPVWFCYTFVMGLISCWLVEKYRSILPSILFHMVFNLLGGVIIPNTPDVVGTVYLIVGLLSSVILAVVLITKNLKSRTEQSIAEA